MEHIIFISTAWGPINGGINAYNYDLCISLQKNLPSNIRIICVVGNEIGAHDFIYPNNIEFICLKKDCSEVNKNDSNNIASQIKNNGFNPIWFIGHDVTTGYAAIGCTQFFPNSHSCIIHHMDYESYDSYKGENIEINKQKINKQIELLKNADLVLGVGPKLFQSAKNKIRNGKCKFVDFIIPGLTDVDGLELQDPFSVICFGRIEEKIEPIKQINLAVWGLASTFIEDNNRKLLGNDPKLTLVGLTNSEKDKKILDKIKEEAYKLSNRLFTINAIPFLSNRQDLLIEIKRHQLCMMLSIHEGFGLAGWEAIAAEVPLVTTMNSGLYEFLCELGPEMSSRVIGVDIRGSHKDYNDKDIELIKTKIISYRIDKNKFKNNASQLKKLLLKKGYTWKNMSDEFISKLYDVTNKFGITKNSNVLIKSKKNENISMVYEPAGESEVSKEIINSPALARVCNYFEPFSVETIRNTITHSDDISAFLSASIGEHPNSRNPHKRYHLGHFFFVKIIDALLELYITADKIHLCIFPSMNYYTSDPNYRQMLIGIQSIWNTCFHENIVTNRIDQLVRVSDLTNYYYIVEWLRKQRNNFLKLSERDKSQLDLFWARQLTKNEEENLALKCQYIIDGENDASYLEILTFACLMYKPSKWFNEQWFVSALSSLLETDNNNIQNKILGANHITIIESSKNMKSWEAMSYCCKHFNIKGFPARAYFKTLPDLRNSPMSSSNFSDAIFLYESTKKLKNRINDQLIENILRDFQLEKDFNLITLEELIQEGRKRLSQQLKYNGRKRTTKRNK